MISQHALKRASTRYGLQLTEPMVEYITTDIKHNFNKTLLAHAGDGRTIHLVFLFKNMKIDKKLLLIFCKKTNSIITFLPSELIPIVESVRKERKLLKKLLRLDGSGLYKNNENELPVRHTIKLKEFSNFEMIPIITIINCIVDRKIKNINYEVPVI